MLSSTGSARIKFRGLFASVFLLVNLVGMTSSHAQQTTLGIYTCTDARGRKFTSDRPIPECSDREQKQLNPSGTLKAKLGPPLTAQERAALEVKEKMEMEERARLNEEKRRDRALLNRYPNQSVHDKERAEALGQIGVVRQAASNRLEELLRQRSTINQELEFYQKDLGKAPPSLRRQADEVTQSMSVQNRFIAEQDAELKRVNARFDEELPRLKQAWAPLSLSPSAVGNRTR